MNLRKPLVALAMAIAVGVGFRTASANTSTVTITPGTSLPGGGTVPTQDNAVATFDFEAGQLTITITNNFKDSDLSQYDITAAIRGLSFTISQTPALASNAITSFTANGNLITVAGNGSYTSATSDTDLTAANPAVGAGWTYAGTDPYTVGIGNIGQPVTSNDPLILGAPNGSNLYADANSSIAGNGPHNPLVQETAKFVFDITGLSASATLSTTAGAKFFFGTSDTTGTPGIVVNNPPGGGGSGQSTPLPASVWGGAALIAGLAAVRKFRRKIA